MSDVTICRACGLPRFHGPAGYAGAQCLCQWKGATLPQMYDVLIKREERYTVIKHKDLTVDDRAELDQFIQSRHIPTRKCLVIESDWPEYEPAWRMIEARVTGASTKPATVPSLNQQLLEALEGMLLHIREPESESEFQWSEHFKKQKAAFVAARAAIAAARKGEV